MLDVAAIHRGRAPTKNEEAEAEADSHNEFNRKRLDPQPREGLAWWKVIGIAVGLLVAAGYAGLL